MSYRLSDRKPGERLTGDNLEEVQDRWGDRYQFRDRGFTPGDINLGDGVLGKRMKELKERLKDRTGKLPDERLEEFRERLKERAGNLSEEQLEELKEGMKGRSGEVRERWKDLKGGLKERLTDPAR